MPHGSVPDALFWDTNDPYRYLRLVPGLARTSSSMAARITRRAGTGYPGAFRAPRAGPARHCCPAPTLSHRWSGQVIETPDGLPYIGETTERQFVATGFGGNGLTSGRFPQSWRATILRRANPWSGLFDAGRTNLRRGSGTTSTKPGLSPLPDSRLLRRTRGQISDRFHPGKATSSSWMAIAAAVYREN